ncbi:Crp/Fnr family transcriptional regulator [Hydrogenophaga palleronii]|uniref:Crp/Fnr family transcriptional regulator n=1 Tax=Hydrogenophaga palleronii TaxID=65655 RepID=UPI0008258029|nr:Crp/Fnr family transcriptional regulator [Hydrogenophaga palleronii]
MPSQSHLSSDHQLKIPWLPILATEHRSWVIQALQVSEATAGELVCRVGAEPTHWIGVLEGLVKMSGFAANGRTVTFAGFPSGGWFGEGTILKGESYRYEIQVLQPGLLARLPVTVFHRLLEESIEFNRFLMRQFNERLGQFIAYKAAEQTLGVEEQLARALCTLFDPVLYPAAAPVLRITQQELAYLVGTSRQQINQALGLLREAGAAEAAYGGVRLLDYQCLRNVGTRG